MGYIFPDMIYLPNSIGTKEKGFKLLKIYIIIQVTIILGVDIMKGNEEEKVKTDEQTESINEKLEFLKNVIEIDIIKKLAQKDPDKMADIIRNWLSK